MKEVLDTRFLSEYFFSDQLESKKKTTRKLKELIEKNEGILPTIVVAEAIQITCEKRGASIAESRYRALIQSGIQVQNLTPEIAKHAGMLKANHKNVPMGDCIIAATAIANHARIISDDLHFDSIKEIKRVWI